MYRSFLRLEDNTILLDIQDDGRGFEPPEQLSSLAQHDHFGLIGLEEHAASVGGTLNLQAAPQQGTRVTVKVPVTKLAEKSL